MSRVLSAAVLALAILVGGCGGDDDQDDGGAADKPAATETQPAEEPQAGCQDIEQPPPRDGGGQEKPSKTLDESKTYEVVFETSCGAFTIRLDQKTSPQAAASFVSLARNGFFDDTIFHRIVPGFVIQGGDPTVSGSGGPGYSTRDRVPQDAAYDPGVVAMAKAGNEPSGTAGSQFFVVTGRRRGPDARLRAAREGHEGHGGRAGDRPARRSRQRRHGHAAPVGGDPEDHRP